MAILSKLVGVSVSSLKYEITSPNKSAVSTHCCSCPVVGVPETNRLTIEPDVDGTPGAGCSIARTDAVIASTDSTPSVCDADNECRCRAIYTEGTVAKFTLKTTMCRMLEDFDVPAVRIVRGNAEKTAMRLRYDAGRGMSCRTGCELCKSSMRNER